MYQLEQLAIEFQFYDKARGISEKTIVKHRKHLGMFLRFLQQKHEIMQLSAVTSTHIREFLVQLLESGKAESYVNSHLRSLRAFFVFLEEESIITVPENPCLRVKWLKEQEKVIQTFTDEEVKQMISCADKTRGSKTVSPSQQYLSQWINVNKVDTKRADT